MSELMKKYGYEKFKFHYDSINSYWLAELPTNYAKFKFHYDSINSKDALVTQYAELKFKFHYDSINSYSYLLSRHLKPNLNSIMILLIPNAVIDYGREKTI